jgi:hypothetical protein
MNPPVTAKRPVAGRDLGKGAVSRGDGMDNPVYKIPPKPGEIKGLYQMYSPIYKCFSILEWHIT